MRPVATMASRKHTWALWISVFILLLLTILSQVGRAWSEVLLPDSPRLLLMLTSSGDMTVRAISNMSFAEFYPFGVGRRLIADPFWIYLGWFGAAKLKNSKVARFRKIADKVEKMEDRDIEQDRAVMFVLFAHFVSADMFSCFVLGFRRVPLKIVVPVNLAGTFSTVALMYWVGGLLQPFIYWVDLVSRIFTVIIFLTAIYLVFRFVRDLLSSNGQVPG